MIDTLVAQRPAARKLCMGMQLGVGSDYVVVTLHRPSNVDDPEALRVLLESFARIADERPVVLPLHPRTRARATEFGLEPLLRKLRVTEPLGYLEMLGLTESATVVLTDSGGLQEETTALAVPCVTLREQTERPVTITHGTNRLAPWPLTTDGILNAYDDALARRERSSEIPDGWDGHAAERVADALATTEPGARVRAKGNHGIH
jgi:UDP-N-acetylglucosamine 2-epimerase (non-hydrolysing)